MKEGDFVSVRSLNLAGFVLIGQGGHTDTWCDGRQAVNTWGGSVDWGVPMPQRRVQRVYGCDCKGRPPCPNGRKSERKAPNSGVIHDQTQPTPPDNDL